MHFQVGFEERGLPLIGKNYFFELTFSVNDLLFFQYNI
jgi:hypothetical protein